MAYDLTGTQTIVFRGGVGLFYDRPDGNTVFSIPGNPPIAESQDLRNGQLQNLGTGLSHGGRVEPGHRSSTTRRSRRRCSGTRACRWRCRGPRRSTSPTSATTATTGWAGSRAARRSEPERGRPRRGLPAAEPGPDAARRARRRAPRRSRPTCCGRFRGFGIDRAAHDGVLRQVPLDSDVVQPSVPRRACRSASTTRWSILLEGNTGLTTRLQHNADGTLLGAGRPGGVRGAEQAAGDSAARPARQLRVGHAGPGGRWWREARARLLVNDWQLSGIVNLSSGTNYDLAYSLPEQRRQREPDGLAGLRRADPATSGDPGSGCSSDQYAQFNTTAVTGPAYGSDGLESGRNIMRGCCSGIIDLSLGAQHPPGWRPCGAAACGRVQRVQHRQLQRPSDDRCSTTTRRDQTRPQPAVQRRRHRSTRRA